MLARSLKVCSRTWGGAIYPELSILGLQFSAVGSYQLDHHLSDPLLFPPSRECVIHVQCRQATEAKDSEGWRGSCCIATQQLIRAARYLPRPRSSKPCQVHSVQDALRMVETLLTVRWLRLTDLANMSCSIMRCNWHGRKNKQARRDIKILVL